MGAHGPLNDQDQDQSNTKINQYMIYLQNQYIYGDSINQIFSLEV
jgi:hypothetical protein